MYSLLPSLNPSLFSIPFKVQQSNVVALGPSSLKFSGSSVGWPIAAVGEEQTSDSDIASSQRTPSQDSFAGLLRRMPKVIHDLFVKRSSMIYL